MESLELKGLNKQELEDLRARLDKIEEEVNKDLPYANLSPQEQKLYDFLNHTSLQIVYEVKKMKYWSRELQKSVDELIALKKEKNKYIKGEGIK